MPQGLTRCDCRVYCDHSYPEITIGTRANHRKDEKIMDIQARLGRAPYIRGHRVDIHTRHRDPHLPPFRPERAQDTTNGPSSSRAHGPEPSRSGVHRPQPSSSHPRPPDRGRLSTQTSPHTGHTEAALEMMESEIRMRALSFSTSLASPLVFVNEPANLPYIHEATLTPNSGTYQLKPAARVNVSFLEHENRLWEILGLVHVLPPCARRDEVENIIFLEIDRCNTEKELHWNQQRMHIDMGKVVVNNGTPHNSNRASEF
ncbi:hypothetical protein B0H13DRAFT_1884136 [Mycena leptocephala]|nr:hypothetical protein B0H13DRAFT_1884136 [Mycena leptocephala]